MDAIILYKIIFIILIKFALSAHVSLYSDINHEGLFLELDNIVKCQNLPFGDNSVSSVDTHGGCIILFDDRDCTGHSLRLKPGVHSHNNLVMWDFNDRTSSVGPCNEEQRKEQIKHPGVSLYEKDNHKDLLFETYSLCSCQNLPSFAKNKASSVNTHGNCVIFFDDYNCKGRQLMLNPWDSGHSLSDHSFNNMVSSMKPCEKGKHCTILEASVIDVEFAEDLNTLLDKALVDEIYSAKSLIVNNGSGKITEEVTKTITWTDEFYFEKTKAFSNIHKVNVELGLSIKAKSGFFGLFEGEIETSLKAGYGYERHDSGSSKSGIKTTKEHTVTNKKIFEVPACTVYDVAAVVEMTRKTPLNFKLVLKVTGKDVKRVMSGNQIKESLPSQLEFDRIEGNSVIAKASGKMEANLGLKSGIKANSRSLQDCHRKKK